jgi:hypothetical protein
VVNSKMVSSMDKVGLHITPAIFIRADMRATIVLDMEFSLSERINIGSKGTLIRCPRVKEPFT